MGSGGGVLKSTVIITDAEGNSGGTVVFNFMMRGCGSALLTGVHPCQLDQWVQSALASDNEIKTTRLEKVDGASRVE